MKTVKPPEEMGECTGTILRRRDDGTGIKVNKQIREGLSSSQYYSVWQGRTYNRKTGSHSVELRLADEGVLGYDDKRQHNDI